MTKIVELRPNRHLINTKFEKYQFSTDEVPIHREIDLKANIQKIELTTNRDSLLETRLFALHNHLFKNPYDTSYWLIDERWCVFRLKQDGDLEQMHIIHDSEKNVPNLLYNPSIGFTNNHIVAISDGGNCLKLLTMNEKECGKSFILDGSEPGVILDVQYVHISSTVLIAMYDINSENEKKYSRLLLLTYIWKNAGDTSESFELIKKENLKVNGAVEYVYIEDSGRYLHSICQDYIIFENAKEKESTNNTQDMEKKPETKIPKYYWSQDEESISVWFPIDKQYKDKVKVNVTSLEVLVTVDNNVLIQGECQHRLHENLTCWEYEQNNFKLELYKYEAGLMWSELIRNDTGGEYLPNETLAAEIHSKLAHLCTVQADNKQEGQPCVGFNAEQLEECDLEGKDNFLQRIDLVAQTNTHLAMLGIGNHVLFTNKTKSGQAICMRYDNDACLWITGEVNDAKWNMEHYFTFPGLGYVEASKSNKKFCVSPEDGSYVAILEHTRYIFLYKRPEANAQVGKQWIVDLSTETSPIIGVAATNKYLTILTKNKLYQLSICF